MIEVGDSVRLSDKVLASKIALVERAYSRFMVVTEIKPNGFAVCVPSHVHDVDRRPCEVHLENLVLVQKGQNWGAPVTGNHDPQDYLDQYGDPDFMEDDS